LRIRQHAIARSTLSPGEIEDVFLGCAIPEGATGWNVARNGDSIFLF
jgi:acetyl-CoA C-acetyltransferase